METGNCELCYSSDAPKVVFHRDIDDDKLMHDEAYICVLCRIEYSNDFELFYVINQKRLMLEEEEDDDWEDEEEDLDEMVV